MLFFCAMILISLWFQWQCSSPTRLSIQLMEYGHEKPEVTAVSIDPNFSSYLFSEYLCSTSDKKLSEGVYLGRYLPTHSDATDSIPLVCAWSCAALPGISGNIQIMMNLQILWRQWMVSMLWMVLNARYPARPLRYAILFRLGIPSQAFCSWE